MIKNTFGYNGLKVVCRELNKLGLIQLKWNDLDSETLKYGTTLKIVKSSDSDTAVAQVKTQKSDKTQNYKTESVYVVKKGDSLYSISQKIPGVTVADLKKWNGISGKNIQPGMKLKING